jgi:hypothetical protein
MDMESRAQAVAPLLRVAEARMAVLYLEKAENWAAEVDEEIVAALADVHSRLLDKIVCMAAGDAGRKVTA